MTIAWPQIVAMVLEVLKSNSATSLRSSLRLNFYTEEATTCIFNSRCSSARTAKQFLSVTQSYCFPRCVLQTDWEDAPHAEDLCSGVSAFMATGGLAEEGGILNYGSLSTLAYFMSLGNPVRKECLHLFFRHEQVCGSWVVEHPWGLHQFNSV